MFTVMRSMATAMENLEAISFGFFQPPVFRRLPFVPSSLIHCLNGRITYSRCG